MMRIQAILAAVAAGMLGASSLALGQQRVGPIYPQNPNSPPATGSGPARAYSGYDPFQFDARTGRFYYAPIPYQTESPQSAYDPWQFNWYSGRWNYQSVPPEALGYGYNPPMTGARGDGGPASNYLGPYLPEAQSASARIGPSAPASGTSGVTPGAVPIPKAVPINPSTLAPLQPPLTIHHVAPTTRPTNAPRTSPPTRPSTMPSLASRYPTTHPMGDRDNGGWVTLNGLTGQWQFDYSRGRWVFVLPPDR